MQYLKCNRGPELSIIPTLNDKYFSRVWHSSLSPFFQCCGDVENNHIIFHFDKEYFKLYNIYKGSYKKSNVIGDKNIYD